MPGRELPTHLAPGRDSGLELPGESREPPEGRALRSAVEDQLPWCLATCFEMSSAAATYLGGASSTRAAYPCHDPSTQSSMARAEMARVP
jgi:hypothetical protein